MSFSSNVSKQNEDETSSKTEIGNIVLSRIANCRNSVLASQIQKVLPNVKSFEKRGSLHNALQDMSRELLLQDPIQNKVILELPRKSIHTTEVIMQEYVMPGKKEELLTDSFVQNLPVSIADKRHYRKSIFALKRKPWYIKFRDFLEKKWENFVSYFDLWNKTLNIIEGQHGAAVVSYFVFIRWLLHMNIIIFLLNLIFLVIPQVFTPGKGTITVNYTVEYFSEVASNSYNGLMEMYNQGFINYWAESVNLNGDATYIGINGTNSSIETIVQHCQILYAQQISNDSHSGCFAVIQSLLQGTGQLEPTLLFTGFYPPFNVDFIGHVYKMSIAFLCVLLASFIVCFSMMIQYSSIGIQEEFTAQSRKSVFFSNEVFSAWEYCIKDPKCADQLHHRFVLDMKTALNEERFKKAVTQRSTRTWLKLHLLRIFINIFILLWLFACCYIIYFVAVYQMREKQIHALDDIGFKTFFVQFLPSFTLIILNSISPTAFKMLLPFEKYSARIEVNITIVRNVILYLSSVFILLNTFYEQVACMAKDICGAGVDITCSSPRCWETYIGQQLYKLSLTKLFVQLGVFLCSDLLIYYVKQRYDNKCTRLWGAPIFSLPSEVLSAINSQTILWLGVFYSPLLPAVMILHLVIIFYIKKTKVLKLCAPKESSYRASRINSVFIFIMLITFFVVMIVQSYALFSIAPSRGCGPFRYLKRMVEAVPDGIRNLLSILMSHWCLLILILIACIAIHYYLRIIASQKELIKKLKGQLVLESYDKQFLLQSMANL